MRTDREIEEKNQLWTLWGHPQRLESNYLLTTTSNFLMSHHHHHLLLRILPSLLYSSSSSFFYYWVSSSSFLYAVFDLVKRSHLLIHCHFTVILFFSAKSSRHSFTSSFFVRPSFSFFQCYFYPSLLCVSCDVNIMSYIQSCYETIL